jgi:tripartite-type tricarboxylate transporter receptor subunit TctC
MRLRRPILNTLAAVAVAAVTLATSLPALAQTAFPSRPVRMVVNFPPGGAADLIARAVAAPLSDSFGQPVVVLLSSGGMVSVNPHIYPKMSFDPVRELMPVASAARVLVFLVARADLPVADVREFLAYVKARPGKLSFGSAGNGSSPHLAAEMMKSQAELFAVHVPYRGAAPALQDLLAGQIDFYFDPGIGLNQVRAGRLKMLAVGSLQRSPLFPQTPTLDEAGLKGFDADTVFGFYAPAGTPAEVITRLNAEINRALGMTAVAERIRALGGEPLPLSPAQFGARVADDSKRFGAIIRERNIRGD